MSKISSNTQDDQTNPTLFVLEPVAGKKVSVEFTAPDLSSLGGLTLVREYEKSSSTIIDRIESCIKDPRFEPMVVHSQTEMRSAVSSGNPCHPRHRKSHPLSFFV